MKTTPLDFTAVKKVSQLLGKSSSFLQVNNKVFFPHKPQIKNHIAPMERIHTCSQRSGGGGHSRTDCETPKSLDESDLVWSQFLSGSERQRGAECGVHHSSVGLDMLLPQSKKSCTELALYLNEVWKHSGQQHSLQQLVLVAVLIAH